MVFNRDSVKLANHFIYEFIINGMPYTVEYVSILLTAKICAYCDGHNARPRGSAEPRWSLKLHRHRDHSHSPISVRLVSCSRWRFSGSLGLLFWSRSSTDYIRVPHLRSASWSAMTTASVCIFRCQRIRRTLLPITCKYSSLRHSSTNHDICDPFSNQNEICTTFLKGLTS